MVGKQLKKLREAKQKSQQEVCSALNIEQSTLANYENDKRTPKIEILIKLAEYYNVSIDYILGRDSSDSDGVRSIFGYQGGDEAAMSFPHKLAAQIDYNCAKIFDLAKALGVSEKTILDWLCGKDDSYSNYYEQLSDFFGVQIRYWTSPGALSPGIEPNMEEYLLILLHRAYKEKGMLDEIYGTIEHFFPGIITISDDEEAKVISVFRELNEDSRDIIKGEMKKVLRSQRYEESVAADNSLQKTGTDNTGK